MGPKATSILFFLVLFIHLVALRKIIFSWNTLGVFVLSNVLFSILGILLFPWIYNAISSSFYVFELGIISDNEIIKTQFISILGLLTVIYSYIVSSIIFSNRLISYNLLSSAVNLKSGFSQNNLIILTIVTLGFVFISVILNGDHLVSGIINGFISRNPAALLIARRGITSNYFYTISVYNILPILTIALYLQSTFYRNFSVKILYYITLLVSFFLLVMMFQKRPLMLFVLTLILSNYWVSIQKRGPKINLNNNIMVLKKKHIKVVGGLFAIFSLLIILYYFQTTYKFDNIFQGIGTLSVVTFSRIFGRLALPSFMYVHYYPNIEPFYGISNIGLLAKLFNIPLYENSKIVYTYFTSGGEDGSVAIASIFDFYAALGWVGLFLGTSSIGIALAIGNIFLNKLKPNLSSILITIFSFVTVYYLSQASLAKAVMGYGGIFFVSVWLLSLKNFRIKFKRKLSKN